MPEDISFFLHTPPGFAHSGLRFVEVAPLALDLQGYSPACRRSRESRRR